MYATDEKAQVTMLTISLQTSPRSDPLPFIKGTQISTKMMKKHAEAWLVVVNTLGCDKQSKAVPKMD